MNCFFRKKESLHFFVFLMVCLNVGGVICSQSAPSYKIEVKNKFHSKHHRDKLWGVTYPNDGAATVDGKDVREFPNVEKFYSYGKSVAGYKDPAWSESNDKWRFVKQFAVSKGVIYWMKPTENVISYWNTITNEVGSFQPYNEAGEPLELINKIGYGSITQDWYGNLIFAYYTQQDQAIQGYGTIDGRNTVYGTCVPRTVRLTDMSGNFSQNCAMEWIKGTYKTKPTTGVVQTRHPNIPKSNINSETSTPEGNEVHTQYLTASGDLYDMHWSSSSVYSGYSGGYVFEAYNNIVFANMFANGKYANWYLNYKVQHQPYTGANYVTVTPNQSYINEGLYRECDELEYFWSSPGVAYAEFAHPGGDFLNDGVQYDLLGNLNQYYAYDYGTLDYLPDYTLDGTSVALTQTGYDWTVGMESDSIKGQRVLVNSSWMNRVPNQYIGSSYNTYVRDGSIDIRTCSYDGGYDADGVDSDGNPCQWLGNPTRNYTKVASGYGYNNTKCTDPVGGIAVNCWNELERVNNNVLALYTHVPGQGFSKYFITAVRQDNPVTLHEIVRVCYEASKSESDPDYVKIGGVKAKITWTAQEYDRETLNRYEIWYKTYKRDADNNLVSDCGDTWKKAGLASIDYSDKKYDEDREGVFYHELTYGGADTKDTSDDYDLTYEYMIIPIYDASDHCGTEAIYDQKVPSAAPRYPATATLSQITEGEGNSQKYSFNIKLDLTPNENLEIPYQENCVSKISIPHYWVVIDSDSDEERAQIANALNEASALIAVDETGKELTDVTITVNYDATQPNKDYTIEANNCYHYPIKGYNLFVKHENNRVYTTADKFPSIVWKNVDPNITYKVKVYCRAVREANFIATPGVETKMTVPSATLSMTSAMMQPLEGEYGDMQRDEILPMGAKLKEGCNDVTNPVNINAANTLGTNGSVINPLMVTDEVLANWNIQYTYHIMQNNVDVIEPIILPASNEDAKIYSNTTSVIADILGLPIDKTDWDVYTMMELNDTEKANNENIIKQGYNTSTSSNSYSTKIDVKYIRKTKAVEVSAIGVASDLVMDASMSGTPFPALDLIFDQTLSALFQREFTHWDANFSENGGYYPKYYDAAIQFNWNYNENDNLNKYIGFHAISGFDCEGHYESSTSTTWTKYYAGSIITDENVNNYNLTLSRSGLNGFLLGIGYNGSDENNWSEMAVAEKRLPLNIHYVYAGKEWLSNAEPDRMKATMNVILTVDYPVIEGITLKVNEYPGENKLYSMESASATFATPSTTMNMITVPNTMNDLYVGATTTVTGVEGILTNACGGVNLYPNPVNTTLILQAPMTIYDVKIFTMEGQLVKMVTDINDTIAKINVEELPQGMYIVNTLGVAKIMIKQ